MKREQQKKFLMNVLVFTSPALAVFFLQLSKGVDWKTAGLVALLAFWGLLADYLKKLKE